MREKEIVSIDQGLDFLLSHFQEPIWPRNLATAATNTKQHVVEDRDKALLYFKGALGQDCRIAIYPNYERMKELGYKNLGPSHIPDQLLIDIDLDTLSSKDDRGRPIGQPLEEFDAALKITLRNIKKHLHGAQPTIVWTGNGVHILQPLLLDMALEDMPEFNRFRKNSTDVSVRFMRWAVRRLSANKSDPKHNPSFASCLTRCPGSINSKNGETVKILQRWNRIRAKPSREFITDFLIALVQKDVDENVNNVKFHIIDKNRHSTTTNWIERLLSVPISDYRKGARDLILIPYLVVRRGLSPNEVYDIVVAWAEKSSELRPLQPSHNAYASRVRTRIQEVIRDKVPPMTFAKFQETQPEIAELINGKDINIGHNYTMTNNMQESINTNEKKEIENKKLLSQKALENLRKNKEQKARDSKYLSWEDGEEKELHFDVEKIRQVPSKFGDDKMRYEYTVVDLRNFPDMEKLWTVSKKTSDKIDEQLADGHSILLVECKGEGVKREYKISPRD